MIELFTNLGFMYPNALWALSVIPIVYLVVKSLPPKPKTFDFSTFYLIQRINNNLTEKKSCPLWLLLLRLLLIIFIIIYFAKPFLNNSKINKKIDNYVVYADMEWSTAANWEKYKSTLMDIMLEAEKLNRNFYLIDSVNNESNKGKKFLSSNHLSNYLRDISPNPWQNDRLNIIKKLDKIEYNQNSRYFYVFSKYDNYTNENLKSDIVTYLGKKYPSLELIYLVNEVTILEKPIIIGESIELKVKRLGDLSQDNFIIRITSSNNQIIHEKSYQFEKNKYIRLVKEFFPISVINDFKKVELINQNHAGAVFYFDDLNKKQIIGVLSEDKNYEENPLLSPIYYIIKALGNNNKILIGNLDKLINANADILIFPDTGIVDSKNLMFLKKWVSNGGLLVRFCGSKFVNSDSMLLSSKIEKKRIRYLGGNLSWNNEIGIKEFPSNSIFNGLKIPDNIIIKKQLLFESQSNQEFDILATLKDDTPLVSLKNLGKGKIVFFHFTANNDWSNIPLTSLFVDMLSRATLLNQMKENETLKELDIETEIDGFGNIVKARREVKLRDSLAIKNLFPSKEVLPGIYANDELNVALNLAGKIRVSNLEKTNTSDSLETNKFFNSISDLSKILLILILILSILDILASIFIRNNINITKKIRLKKSILNFLIFLLIFSKIDSIGASDFANDTYLAYVKNVDKEINNVSYQGLKTLSEVLDRRTSISPKGVVEVDLENDNFFFFPFIYWPINENFINLNNKTKNKIKYYLNSGGIIFFDIFGISKNQSSFDSFLKKTLIYLKGITTNELLQINKNHTLYKSFYLLNNFPGRWDRKVLLVDNNSMKINDGVSNIILGFNDWASAWAIDENNYPLFPVVPGGEKQREVAYRVGINITMYALTGNYKNDQVHSKSILERLRKSKND